MRRQRIQTKVYPIDTEKAVAVGLRLPFDAPAIFGQNYTTQDQLKTNLINFMLTNPGERLFNLSFGAGIRDLLFSPDDDLQAIDNAIRTAVSNQFPQIDIQSLTVTSPDNTHTLYITLKYSFNNTDNQITISV
jgi:phage baseplate assembly protein W